MKNAWIDVNDCAGWLACLMLGCSAASGVAAEWGAAAAELEPLQHEIAAADVHEAPLAAKAGPLSFGKAWQIPSWIDPRGDAGVDDVDGEGASGGIDLVGFAFGHHGHQAACGPECYDCPPSSILDDHLGCGVRWTATVDAMLLWQNNIASRPLFISTASPFATAVDANQLQTPTSVGPRFGLFYHIDNCHSIEGNYFNVQSFQGGVSAALRGQRLCSGRSRQPASLCCGWRAGDLQRRNQVGGAQLATSRRAGHLAGRLPLGGVERRSQCAVDQPAWPRPDRRGHGQRPLRRPAGG